VHPGKLIASPQEKESTTSQRKLQTRVGISIVIRLLYLDGLLRGKWEATKRAMVNKDVEKAMSYFADHSKKKVSKGQV
jgi:hypothetical protein